MTKSEDLHQLNLCLGESLIRGNIATEGNDPKTQKSRF
jgi:hypothetical protein